MTIVQDQNKQNGGQEVAIMYLITVCKWFFEGYFGGSTELFNFFKVTVEVSI